MYSRGCAYYRRELENKISFKEYDPIKLENELPKTRGAQVWLSLWEPNLGMLDRQPEFWNILKENYEQYLYRALRIQIFAVKLDGTSFKNFLEAVRGEDTELLLSFGRGGTQTVEWVSRYDVTAATFNNCFMWGNKVRGAIKQLQSSQFLRMIALIDAAEEQIIPALQLKSELYCIFLWPKEDRYVQTPRFKKVLNSLLDTTQYPSEILIGKYLRNKKSAEEAWVPYCGFQDIKRTCEQLNARKESPNFWVKVVQDAMEQKKQIKFARSKLMFVGQGRAGKTSTINSLLHLPFNATQDSTVVADAKGQIAITTTDVSVTSWQKKDYVNNPVNSDFKEIVLNFKHKGDNMLVNMPRARRLNQRVQLGRSRSTRTESSLVQPGKASIGPNLSVKFSLDLEEALSGTSTEVQREIIPVEEIQGKVKLTRTITLWDFGGQEVFYTVHHLFLTNNGVYVLVFNIIRMINLDEREKEKANIKYWLDSVTLYAPEAPILIVATHCYGLPKEAIEEVNTNVFDEILDEFVERDWECNHFPNDDEKLNFFTIENSDIEVGRKQKQVEVLQTKIEEAVQEASTLFEQYSKSVPLSWVYFMDRLTKDGKKKLEYKTVLEQSKLCGIEEDELEQALQLYHEYGTILSFRKDREKNKVLGEHIILSPQWLVAALKTFLYDSRIRTERKGTVDRKDRKKLKQYAMTGILVDSVFRKLLSDFSKGEIHFLQTLFRKMMLIADYNFSQSRSESYSPWFVPSMCPILVKPDGVEAIRKRKDVLHLQYVTKRRQPQGFFERIICLFLRKSNAQEGARKPDISKTDYIIYVSNIPVFISNDYDDPYKISLRMENIAENSLNLLEVINTAKAVLADLNSVPLGRALDLSIHVIGINENEKELSCSLAQIESALKNKKKRILPLGTPFYADISCFLGMSEIFKASKQVDRVVREQRQVNKSAKYDCFIAHEWGTSEDGYAAHNVAIELYKRLTEAGFKVWLDEYNLSANVESDITNGIENSTVIICLLTHRYFQRLDQTDTTAAKEFKFAVARRGVGSIVPLILDSKYLNPRNWFGTGLYHLGGVLYYNYSSGSAKNSTWSEILNRVKEIVKYAK